MSKEIQQERAIFVVARVFTSTFNILHSIFDIRFWTFDIQYYFASTYCQQ
jgi:hypothetical protein